MREDCSRVSGGEIRRFLYETMNAEPLSVFVDESGRFQHPDTDSRFYILGMVFHNQSFDISRLVRDLIVGELPIRETRLVQGWIELHRDELNIEWNTLAAGGAWFTIAGLR